MLALLILSLLASAYAAPSHACTKAEDSPIDWRPKANETRVFRVGHDRNSGREIHVTIPPDFGKNSSEPAPLILAFHDKEMLPLELASASHLSDPNINRNAVVVYPLARNDTWQSDIVVRRWRKNIEQPEYADDIAFVSSIIDDLGSIICHDTSRVYATGMGTGGGLVNLLACDPALSTQITAFGIVAGGFGGRRHAPIWETCAPGRSPVPMLEVHGDEDRILPYFLNEWESAKRRRAVPAFLDEWSDLNGCGEPVGETMDARDATGTDVKVTKLSSGGWVSEGEAYNGGAWRLAKSCPGINGTAPKIEFKPGERLSAHDPEHFTLLHYRLKGFGHGWPLLRLKGADRVFDTTALLLDWFKIHKLPIHLALRVTPQTSTMRVPVDQAAAAVEAIREAGGDVQNVLKDAGDAARGANEGDDGADVADDADVDADDGADVADDADVDADDEPEHDEL
ncbi:hypothetical protein EJ06DRAFT_525419 [Trichodelitschia bisporula]|uniref:feruloyl esterase n=1 Tax=Trichodelitschia bisporula TaxID=703511 RepID=A0A6G1I9X5_9PEZI|nr:hypothetical protein EJ06DRAFT_525419 [Trichodelitschia bisporula]